MKKIIFFVALFMLSVYSLIRLNPKHESTPIAAREEEEFRGPVEFAKFHRAIRTAEGDSKPAYRAGYKITELTKAKAYAAAHRKAEDEYRMVFKERGPSNVPGRTRGLIVDPDDVSKNTWYAGSAGGGVWKTTNGGTLWTLLTPDLPNLATTVLAMSESNHNTIYLGTGEGFFNLDGISGGGIFKSTDRGITWSLLPSTLPFGDINRIAISPTAENTLVAATTTGIYRSTNGGTSWTKTLNEVYIQDLKATPGNFAVQYASQNGIGVWKSIDGGENWTLSNEGMGPVARVELAVSPVTPTRIFASAEVSFGAGSKILLSDDSGASWKEVTVQLQDEQADFLNGQGWYDNTIVCDPFDKDAIYFGGVGIFRLKVTAGSSQLIDYEFENDNTFLFMDLVNFGASHNGGTVAVSSLANVAVEIRFGSGQSQSAHRFMVPEGATSGVPETSYSYQDYVTVPFEVWDVTNNRKLMISFRDQGRDGEFNLVHAETASGTATLHSREYLFISNIEYAETPSSQITINGGHTVGEMYNIWPVLTQGATWDENNLPESNFRITLTSRQLLNASTFTCADVYGQYDSKNAFNDFGIDVHPDQHNLVVIPMTATTFKILNANDGGIFVSNTSSVPGVNEGDWTMVGKTYNTTQFYGVDKRPGFDEYFGGSQDNGTWKSKTGEKASASSQYLFNIGGDGFEVIWHNTNDNLMIGGYQGNGFMRSTNRGTSWVSATTGLTGSHPFISKLANSRNLPDRIFALSSDGVFVSQNFGTSWSLTPITEKWGQGSLMDVDVSLADEDIVWAGLGMTTDLNLHVSTNGGASFNKVNNYTDVSMGGITKLATHPTQPNTAYALFSLSGKPKIVMTTNLGQTWQDISGFDINTTSASGFPDVAVYCLYVHPDNIQQIWAGTEIGIVETIDGGDTWALLEDFPNVSVWDMKGVDDQIVIATHGRGIWTGQLQLVTEVGDALAKSSLTIHPNPAQSSTTVEYVLAKPGNADIEIVTMQGARVSLTQRRNLQAGKQTEVLSTTSLKPGTYLVKVKTSEGDATAKLVVR